MSLEELILKKVLVLLMPVLFVSCVSQRSSTTIGNFRVERDLFLAQFDCKTDVDDILSVAGVATMLADTRFSGVRYHAVAGAYGTQEGLYVPANELFEAAFGDNWSDAHSDYKGALRDVARLATDTLEAGGDIWIAEAGQSDFSADLIRKVKAKVPEINTKLRIHIVQHSEWNENNTAPENLSFTKNNTSYHKIPDGNVVGNGSPAFKSDETVNWRAYVQDDRLIQIWTLAFKLANQYNGREGRYKNPAIAKSGVDFSDVVESCWIFKFDYLKDADHFFMEFSGLSEHKYDSSASDSND